MADKVTRSKRYSEGFRCRATKLVAEGGYTYRRLFEQLRVSERQPG